MIRVLGASVSAIVSMLSKDFLKLVFIASIIALPVAWWAMENWLEDFAYRVNIHWWVFVLAGVLAMIIALITISSQAIKAALANPVKNLRIGYRSSATFTAFSIHHSFKNLIVFGFLYNAGVVK